MTAFLQLFGCKVEMSDSDEEFQFPFSRCPPDVGGVDTWDAEGFLSPYMPTTQEKLDFILSTVTFTPEDVLYDLGCGDGRVLFTAVERGCAKAVGVDLDEALVKYVNEQVTIRGLEGKVVGLVEDFLKVDMSEVTVLYLYLLPKALEVLQPRVEQLFATGRLRLVIATLFDFPQLAYNKTFDQTNRFYTYSK